VPSGFVYRFKLDYDLDTIKTSINKDVPFIEGLISDEKLLKIHRELLDSVKVNKFTYPASVSDKEIYSMIESNSEAKVMSIKKVNGVKTCLFSMPDHSIQLRAVELGYKIRGRLNNTRGHVDESEGEEVETIMARFRRIFPESKT
jgi:hypothetical protein